MRLAVLDTIEEIKFFEAKEKGIDPAFYNIEEKSSDEILKRCKSKPESRSKQGLYCKKFFREILSIQSEVTSDQTIQKLVLEINQTRMRDRDVLKLFSYHQS